MTRRSRHPLRSALLGVLVVVALGPTTAACGAAAGSAAASSDTTASSSPSPSGSPPAATGRASATAGESHRAATITIAHFAYDVSGTVEPGAMVMVTNHDAEAHTVTADGKGGFDVKVDPGATVMLQAPGTPGAYPFHCSYHSGMAGTLRVG